MSKIIAVVALVIVMGLGAFGVSKTLNFTSRINNELAGKSEKDAPASLVKEKSHSSHGLQQYQEPGAPKTQVGSFGFLAQSAGSQQQDEATQQKGKRKAYKKADSLGSGTVSSLLKAFHQLSPSKLKGPSKFRM